MYGMNGWNKPDGDSISRQAAINAICEDGTRLERNGRYRMTMVERKQRDVDILEALPAAQPDKSIVEDCLYRIYRNTSVYTATEGRVAIKHYMGELWRELFGEEDVPEWMT